MGSEVTEKKPAKPELIPQELVSIDKIIDDGRNPRIESAADRVKFNYLVRSISANGLLQPILGYWLGGMLHLIFGNRRVAVAKSIGWKRIPAAVLAYVPDEVERERLRGSENIDRDDLNPAEEVLLAMQMTEAVGGDAARAADELGRSETWVRDRLYLQKLTTRCRDMLADGRLNLGQAREIVKWGSTQDQVRIALQVIDEQAKGGPVTRDDIAGWLDLEKRPLSSVPWEKGEPVAGKRDCDGCEHNTQNNRGLFGIVKKADTEAHCSLPACYESKMIVSQETLRRSAEKLKEQVARQEISVESAKSIEAARESSPAWLKPEALQNSMSAMIPPAPPVAVNGAMKKAAEKKALTEKEIRQAALIKWAEEFRKWRAAVGEAIAANAEGSAHLKISLLILEHAEPMAKHPAYWMPYSIYDFKGERKNQVSPAEEEAASPVLARLLTCVMAGTWARLAEMAAAISWGMEPEKLTALAAGPYFCQQLARAFGVGVPAGPQFEYFLPEELRAPKPPAGSSPAAANHTDVFPDGEQAVSLKFDKGGWLHVVTLPALHAHVDIKLTPADGGFMATVQGMYGRGTAAAVLKKENVNGHAVHATKEAAVLTACREADNWLSESVMRTHKRDQATVEKVLEKLRGFMQILAAALEGSAR